jgi:molybdopterin-guanine dinucleotide biosynthesis protein A
MWSAAILAGGRAERLGGLNKATLRLHDESILDRQLAVLGGITDRIVLIANDPEPYRPRGLPMIADLVAGAGPLGGVYTAISASPTDLTLVVACDLPFLTAAFLLHLVSRAVAVDAVVPRTADGVHPLCAVYTRACLVPIQRRLDERRLKVADLLSDLSVAEVGPGEVSRFDADGTLLLNVNTPEDYLLALAKLRLKPPRGRP